MMDQSNEQKKLAVENGMKVAAVGPGGRGTNYENIRSIGGMPQQGLQNLK